MPIIILRSEQEVTTGGRIASAMGYQCFRHGRSALRRPATTVEVVSRLALRACYGMAMALPGQAFTFPRRMSGESMLGPGQRYLWLCIPKNASRSVSAMLSRVGATRLMDTHPAPLTRDWAEANLKPHLIFAVVRNPYDRVLSVWRNKIAPPEPNANTRALYERHPGLYATMSFEAFVGWLGENLPRGQIDKHWAPQSDFLSDGKTLIPQFIGRVENLDRDLRKIASSTGDLGGIIRRNVSTNSDGLSISAMSSTTRRIVCDLYHDDFELFDY